MCVYVCVYVCRCVCVYVRRPVAGHTQHITLKFGVVSSFYPGSELSQGATQNVDPPPRPRPLLLIVSLDQSARDYFTIVLWNSPGQRRVAHTCLI